MANVSYKIYPNQTDEIIESVREAVKKNLKEFIGTKSGRAENQKIVDSVMKWYETGWPLQHIEVNVTIEPG